MYLYMYTHTHTHTHREKLCRHISHYFRLYVILGGIVITKAKIQLVSNHVKH
jgi:hypothetical protein